ncbi:MAG: thiolase domain-containing protein [Anaerolineales bacterium]|nr:thiolase domain-containing protein [Anaerolineales bacterium]
MTEVVIAGIGQTPVGEHWDISLRDLALKAVEAAIQDGAGLQPQALYIGNMLAPVISGQSQLGALIADYAGLGWVESCVVEAAGASGGAALRQGFLAVASGMVDMVLVVGVEKFTDQVGTVVDAALATGMDSDHEAVQGLTPNAQAALMMRRYMHEYGVAREVFGSIPLITHANGVGNKNAIFRKAISLETYTGAGIVDDPLNLFDVAPLADGAAALLLTRPEFIPQGFPHPLVRISGSSLVTDALALHDRSDPLELKAARISVERACRQAGIMPKDVDLFELYDGSSILAVLSLEAAGFAECGKGWQLAQDGNCSLQGKLPICTMGGLKARGNTGGAVGVYQAVEAVLQLRGQAGQNQVKNAQRALVQSLGGPAATAATHVLQKLT